MIIGNGLMATACKEIDREDVLFFASGVSNSRETDSKQFNRERLLLKKTITTYKDKVIVYFSTTSIEDTLYVGHKNKMCDIVGTVPRYIILKLSQAVGVGGNKNNLFNYLKETIKKGDEMKVYLDMERAFIDVDDIIVLLDRLIGTNLYGIHVFSYVEKMMVADIVRIMSEEMGISPIIKLITGVKSVLPENSDNIVIPYSSGYIRNVIKKYV